MRKHKRYYTQFKFLNNLSFKPRAMILKVCSADTGMEKFGNHWSRAVFFNLFWFTAPFGTNRKFGGTLDEIL
jgi:hypothetical protein